MSSPLAAYRQRIADGELQPDADQQRGAERLDQLACELAQWRPGGWLRKSEAPRGVYLWGPVGRGKSLLLDLFFETAPVAKKRRVHFHEFMQARHAFLRDARARFSKDSGAGQDQLIVEAAREVWG